MRTERTHEENQERAYIAASRRSDRSVEARVESARRASEIHKRRTGKALKVAEKDVLAEEMYEEEEDELPAQYKDLNAHLQTGSLDFNARLQAYLANAVAFRKALSGVSKPGDKSKQVDFVNKKQLADHTSLFPKHSDAWKNVVIPKCSESTTSSPYLPQNSASIVGGGGIGKYTPYDSQSSGLRARRLSSGVKPEDMESMGTLKLTDLKRPVVYRPSPRHPIQSKSVRKAAPSPSKTNSPDYSYSGINYDALDHASTSSASEDSLESPFSNRLPTNAVEMLMPMPWKSHSLPSSIPEEKMGYDAEAYRDDLLNQKAEDSIDATLVAPSHGTDIPKAHDRSNDIQWNTSMWNEPQQHDSASQKILESDLWGSFMEENPAPAWDWNTELSL